jgi:hypothetical protein
MVALQRDGAARPMGNMLPAGLNEFERASHSAASWSTTAIAKLYFFRALIGAHPVTFLSAGRLGEYNGERG